MAQRIVTLCDLCATEGQDVAGDTWRTAINPPGSKFRIRDIDLCPEHGAAFAELAAFVADLGRPVAADGTTVAVPETAAPGDRLRCPSCDATSKNLGSLRSHVRRTHGMTLSQASGESGEFVCPECSDDFDTPQGLGVHRYRMHDVAAARERRSDPLPIEALSPTAAGALVSAGTT